MSLGANGYWTWTTDGEDTRNALSAMLPFMYEKRAQAEVALNATKSTWVADKLRLDGMKAVNLRLGRAATVTTQEQLDACRAEAESRTADPEIVPGVEIEFEF